MAFEKLKCVPCEIGVKPIEKLEALKMLESIPDWELDEEGKSIFRRFKFKNFAEAIEFANGVGGLAEEAGHHPVIVMGWGFCRVKWKTSKIDGLHQNDFIMAARSDQLYNS
jgi:4a-hydroxytetrahydrobiopterin dehydratase